MAIQGLLEVPQAPGVHLYRTGELNVTEEAGVAVAALNELGLVGDNDQALESTTNDFNALAKLGYSGRLFVRPPAHPNATFDALLDAAEGKRPEDVLELYRYPNLWVPGTGSESYTDEELDQTASDLAVARLALFNVADTDVDPLLQHLDVPFDDYAKNTWGGKTTQLDEIAKDITAFEAKHPEHDMTDIDHRDFAFMALMDRIKGVGSEDMILSHGFMRIQNLGRRSVGGNSFVGGVNSVGGQLWLVGSDGSAYPRDGVGVSAGLNEAAA